MPEAQKHGTVRDYQLVRRSTMASILCCSERTITRRAKKHGIPKRGLHLEMPPEDPNEEARYLWLEWLERGELSPQQIHAIKQRLM